MAKDRLEGLIPVVEGWHTRVVLLKVCHVIVVVKLHILSSWCIETGSFTLLIIINYILGNMEVSIQQQFCPGERHTISVEESD